MPEHCSAIGWGGRTRPLGNGSKRRRWVSFSAPKSRFQNVDTETQQRITWPPIACETTRELPSFGQKVGQWAAFCEGGHLTRPILYFWTSLGRKTENAVMVAAVFRAGAREWKWP